MNEAPIADLLEQTRVHRACLAELVELAATGRGPELAGSEGRFQKLVEGFATLHQRLADYREQRLSRNSACGGEAAALAGELEQCHRLVARLGKLVAQAQGIRLRHWSPEPECAYTAVGAKPALSSGPRLVRHLA